MTLVVLLGALAGCGGSSGPTDPTSPAPPPTTAGPSQAASTPGKDDDMRTRLANGLRQAFPSDARLVERAETTITTVATPWLDGWQVVDVYNGSGPHPLRFFGALAADGTVLELTGLPQEFTTMTEQAGLSVTSAKTAAAVAEVYLDTTQDFAKASYRVGDIDDIRWLKSLTAAQTDQQAEVRRRFGDQVAPATAKASGSGWAVTVWMVYDKRLDRHTVTIAADGAVTDAVRTVFTTLPVADSY